MSIERDNSEWRFLKSIPKFPRYWILVTRKSILWPAAALVLSLVWIPGTHCFDLSSLQQKPHIDRNLVAAKISSVQPKIFRLKRWNVGQGFGRSESFFVEAMQVRKNAYFCPYDAWVTELDPILLLTVGLVTIIEYYGVPTDLVTPHSYPHNICMLFLNVVKPLAF